MVEMIKINTQKDKQPSTDIFFTHFNRLGNILMQIRDDPNKQSILDAIQNLSNQTRRSFFTLNEKLIINTHQIQSFYTINASP